jgi:hypothetical protein
LDEDLIYGWIFQREFLPVVQDYLPCRRAEVGFCPEAPHWELDNDAGVQYITKIVYSSLRAGT